MGGETYRLGSCGRCRQQLRLCSSCDRGQRFCGGCRPEQRREVVRRAGAAFQGKLRGRRLHAARQARYLERRRDKFVAPKVTHPTVTEEAPPPKPVLALEIASSGKDRHVESRDDEQRCTSCGAPLPTWAQRSRRATLHRAPRVPRGPPLPRR